MSMMISSSLDMLIFLFACCPSNNETEQDYCGAEVSVTGWVYTIVLCPHEREARLKLHLELLVVNHGHSNPFTKPTLKVLKLLFGSWKYQNFQWKLKNHAKQQIIKEQLHCIWTAIILRKQLFPMFMQEVFCFQGAVTALVSSHRPNNMHARLIGDSGMWVCESMLCVCVCVWPALQWWPVCCSPEKKYCRNFPILLKWHFDPTVKWDLQMITSTLWVIVGNF